MAEKTIYQSPSITDTVTIPILTPDAEDCFSDNPYMVNNLIIYYIERDFVGGNVGEVNVVQKNTEAEEAAIAARNEACLDPSSENIETAQRLRTKANALQISTTTFFNEAVPVHVVGNSKYPAWLSTDTDHALLTNVPTDADDNPIFGVFEYIWNPIGMREGQYVACWTWTPLPAGSTLSANVTFTLQGNTAITTSIPSHFTPPEKYDVLLERYLPEMYKDPLTSQDVSPMVLSLFNKSVAKGFTVLEDLANQIVDLQDANATAEAFLGLLSRNFGATLFGEDPTRWRRQIKQSIPLYKKKGTLEGLTEAFDLAGMKLLRLVRMWQIISPYTWVDAFTLENDDETEFVLSHVALEIDPDNFEVAVRSAGSDEYTLISNDDVSITTDAGVSTLTVSAPELGVGDIVKVLYQYNTIDDPTKQDIEDYIRLLPLADARDETAQSYPLKNWNVRMIEEDDPLFSILIPNRNPFHDFLVFGKIRTEFPYSENVYNMEEYNGSIRDSKDPCKIDKNFLDPCGQCLGSKFLIDVQVENLSDDRVLEVQQIIRDFVPFHAIPQTINFSGVLNDFIQPPQERIECLIFYRGEETVICGAGQMVFNRDMIPTDYVLRNQLATGTSVGSGTATAYNNRVMIFSPDVTLGRSGLSTTPSETVLEIYAPHPHAGKYQVANAVNHAAEIDGPISPTAALTEPINQTAFSFTLSNILYSNANTAITQDNTYTLLDASWDLGEIGVKTQWDRDHTSYTGPVWTIVLPAYSSSAFFIQNILPDGSILLYGAGNVPFTQSNANGVTYSILRPNNSVAQTGTLNLTVNLRGLVTVTDMLLTDIRTQVDVDDKHYLHYQDTGDQYLITQLVEDSTTQFYIAGWRDGSVAGKGIDIYQRLADTQYGLLTYEGISLQTVSNYETSLSISNGTNPVPVPLENSSFKENFLIKITDPSQGITEECFGIAEIDGTTINLGGNTYYWTTLGNGGTSVTFEIFQYETVPITIGGISFQRYDRRGDEIITSSEEEEESPMAMAGPPGPAFSDFVRQEEQISYRIEYRDGRVEEGGV